MLSFMFDTNVFNHVLDGIAELSRLVGRAKFYATHVQIDELKKTSNDARRAALLEVFEEITNIRVPTESFVLGSSWLGKAKLGGERPVPTESAVWGVSKWDECKWTASDNLYEPIKSELDRLNQSKPNNVQDSLIAETSIKNGFTLVTHDRDLFWITTKFGGAACNIHEVIKQLANDIVG
jgi:predicted nucleic acid-binding protein